LSVD
jgi:hypothetical protein